MHDRIDTFEAWLHWEGDVHARLDGEEAPPLSITDARGHRGRRADAWSPEELLVGATQASLMHAFLEAARREGLRVLLYESSGLARMREEGGETQLIDLVIRPRVAVDEESAAECARLLLSPTPRLARLLRIELRVEPVIEIWSGPRRRASLGRNQLAER